MREVPLSTWEEFEAKLPSLYEDLKKKREETKLYVSPLLFRGHENASWKLDTTLERFTSRQFTTRDYYHVMQTTKFAAESLTDRLWDLSDYDEKVDEGFPRAPQGYEFMTHIRHHGFPSPLLDWTRSPYVAAFFAFRAQEKISGENAAIYSYVEYLGSAKIGGGGAPAIHVAGPYVTTDKRHHIQQCEYTICKKHIDGEYVYCNHEDAFSRGDEDQDILTKFILPKTERVKVLEKLDLMNINAYSLFGNEEGLMDWLAYREIEKQNPLPPH